MKIELTTEINAAPEKVWEVMIDVERWPEWTQSITSIERLDEAPFGPGSRVRIRQPGFPAVVWRVVDFEPGRYFAWEAPSPGLRSLGRHRVEPHGDGSRVTLTLDQTGLMAGVMGALFGRKSRRYVEMELAGLKGRCEADMPAA